MICNLIAVIELEKFLIKQRVSVEVRKSGADFLTLADNLLQGFKRGRR